MKDTTPPTQSKRLRVPPNLPTLDLFSDELLAAQKQQQHARCNLAVDYANDIITAAQKLSADFFEVQNAAYKSAQKFLNFARDNRYAIKAVGR